MPTTSSAASRKIVRNPAIFLGGLKREKLFCTAAPARYEFLCGPVSEPQIAAIQAFLTHGIIPFGETQAITASRLFNTAARSRRLRVDAIIAATLNTSNFSLFVPQGLKFAKPPAS